MPQAPGSPGSTPGFSGSVPPPPPIGGAKVVVAALSLGVVAVLILSFYIQSVKNEVAAEQFTVFVLKTAIRPGQPMKSSDWKKISVPDKAGFFDSFKELGAYVSREGTDAALQSEVKGGKRWEVAADSGAVILYAFLSPPPEFRELKIESGKVRIALPIKSKLTPGGLRPGTKVDIAAPMLTGGTVPEVMMVMMSMEIKAVGTYTLAEESMSEGSRTIRSFNSVSIDVEPKTALLLATLQKMVSAVGEFELYIVPANEELREPLVQNWTNPNSINPEVLQLIRKNLPAGK